MHHGSDKIMDKMKHCNMSRLADALKEMKELVQKIATCENAEKRKPFSSKSDLDHIDNLKRQKQKLREELDNLQEQSR